MPFSRTFWTIGLLLCLPAPPAVCADEFERHTLDVLQKSVATGEPLAQLSMSAAQALKPLSKRDTNPVVVIETDEGNWTKAEISWGFRRGADGLIPVLLLERYVTYRKDSAGTAIVAGKEVMLFAGFEFNFDIGQVVPPGQGGDITFTAGKTVGVLEGASLWGLDGSALPTPAADAPSDRAGVFPADFAGRWKVDVDGRWKGVWDLKVNGQGRISGTFTSSDTQSTYLLEGRVAAPPHHARITIQFDNAELGIDAYLWTKDKTALAGSGTLAGQTFGVYAVREKAEGE